ncbi:MAG TPA: ATP-binding cassette domain-containing protein [Herpetosiphonaceae bacterium]
MSGPFAITIEHLTVRYSAGAAPVVALQDLSCGIAGGTFIALVGPSGCGKSTLLRTIGGLVAPTAGRISAWAIRH